MADDQVERGHEWIEETVAKIQRPFLAAHPEHRTPVRQAMATIAADPYSIPLRPYHGHDAPAATYVYAMPRTRVEIVFTIIKGDPPRLALFQVLDWDDVPLQSPPAQSVDR